MPPIRLDDLVDGDAPCIVQKTRSRKRPWDDWRAVDSAPKRRLADGRESFKCGHCRAFVGPTISGGRHRNHCPLCLFSRHVDDRRPGDRASRCRSLMAPVGTFHRPNGEQVLLHRCRGCGLERHCRVAADDNVLACLRLPLVQPRGGKAARREGGQDGTEEAIA